MVPHFPEDAVLLAVTFDAYVGKWILGWRDARGFFHYLLWDEDLNEVMEAARRAELATGLAVVNE